MDDPEGGRASAHGGGYPFVLWGRERSYVLLAASEQERSTWVSLVATAANEARASSNFRRQVASFASFDGVSPRQTVASDVDVAAPTTASSSPTEGSGPSQGLAATTVPPPTTPSATSEDGESFTAPVFTPDDAQSACERCGSGFVLVLRINPKHHCRACGKLVCGSCSSKKAPLWRGAGAPVERVCEPCLLAVASPGALARADGLSGTYYRAGSATSASSSPRIASVTSQPRRDGSFAAFPLSSPGVPAAAADAAEPISALQAQQDEVPVTPPQVGSAMKPSSGVVIASSDSATSSAPSASRCTPPVLATSDGMLDDPLPVDSVCADVGPATAAADSAAM